MTRTRMAKTATVLAYDGVEVGFLTVDVTGVEVG